MDQTLTYRPIQADGFDQMHAVVSDWGVVRQLGGWPRPPQPDFTRGRCKPYAGDGFVCAICHDDLLVGTVALTRGELGYFMHPTHAGRGIMSATVDKAIATGFVDEGRALLTASTWIDNAASHHLLTKRGFVHYRSEYIRSKARGFPVMVRQYRLTRDTWDRLRTGAQ